MESQLKELAQEAAIDVEAQEPGNDAQNKAETDSVQVVQVQREIQLMENEIQDISACHAKHVAATTAALETDLHRRLAAEVSDEHRQRIMIEYEVEKTELLTRLDTEQKTRRTRLQAKLEAKRQAAATAVAAAKVDRRSGKTAADHLSRNGRRGKQPASQAEAMLQVDPSYDDVAKSIVADYTNQVVRLSCRFLDCVAADTCACTDGVNMLIADCSRQ